MVDLMREEHQVSLRQGCKAVNLPRSSYSYKRKPKNDQMIIDALLELTSKHPAIGFWQSYYRIRLMGHRWNHKRVYRVYTALKLNIRRRAKKRLPARAKHSCSNRRLPIRYGASTLCTIACGMDGAFGCST